jgi:hypothetical protein
LVWPACDVSELVRPVRDAEDPAYSAFVDGLGDNRAPAVDFILPQPPPTVVSYD